MTYKASLDLFTGRWFVFPVEFPSRRSYVADEAAAVALVRSINGGC